jgi:hypothetical protein
MRFRQSNKCGRTSPTRCASALRQPSLILIVGAALASPLTTAAADRASAQALLSAISEGPGVDQEKLGREIKLAVELGDSVLPALDGRLEKVNGEDEYRRIGYAIAYIGGSSAVSSLQANAFRSPSVTTKALLAFSAPSAPSEDLITTLVSYLDAPHLGDSWIAIVQSAYSLGIMRVRSALPALQAAADEPPGKSSFASSAAKQAISWINGPNAIIKFLVSSSNDDLLRAIVASGLPTLDRRSLWCEHSKPRRTWRKERESWIVEPGCRRRSNTPSIYLDAFRSSDGTRAVISVGFSLGMKDGAGYNFVLHRRGDQWQVVGLQPKWVA